MKLSRYSLVLFLFTVCIFFIPFFWLRPGEMDLGGDNSRLYFYDPLAYLTSQSLYSVSHSGLGGENLSYYAIPFFLLLAGVKALVHSPTILISIFHGLNLSMGFLSCCLIVKELVKQEKDTFPKDHLSTQISSILAGLYYTFSLNPIGWWGYPLLPMNLVFLNPLLFFLLLRFFLTQNMRYLLTVVVITFFFSPNFSFIGAPTFFSFFPLAMLFLVLYTRYVKKRSLPIAKLIVGLVLFIGVQAFHLVPQLTSILTPGTVTNEFLFGNQGKLQWGLKYFQSTAPVVKVSYALLGMQQYVQPEWYWWFFIVFPLLFVLGFLWNKSRLYLLSGMFFLIALFFVTANITPLGLKLYMLAFRIPGFSMFRVYFGQWQWSYLFFYTILLGQALVIVFGNIKPILRFLLTGGIVILLMTTSWSFITGKVTDTTLWQSKDIKSHVKMDPAYDEVLAYIRSLPVDGKIISMPLNDHGYQVLKGENNAAYVGPSTITYLAARNEFNGLAEFDVFGPSLLAAARDKDYSQMKSIFTILNIKYIFYNSDPFIYGENFPGLPYSDVKNYFPDTQDGYKELIANLGVKEIKTIAGKYYIYEISDADYIPHIYVAKKNIYWNDPIAMNVGDPLSFYNNDKIISLYDDSNIYADYLDIFDEAYFKAGNKSTVFDFFETKKQDKFVSPYISQKFTSLLYPLIVLREKWNLAKNTHINDIYIDKTIYYAEKRINELDLINDIPLLHNVTSISALSDSWSEPKIWEFSKYTEYNSWEITMVRYQRIVEKLIDEINNTNESNYSITINKVWLKLYLLEHKNKIRSSFRRYTSLSKAERQYLSNLIEGMFSDIFDKLDITIPDFRKTLYAVEKPSNGTYRVYVSKKDIVDLNIALTIDGKRVYPQASNESDWVRFDDVDIQDKNSVPVELMINKIPNLVEQTTWKTAEQISQSISNDSRQSDQQNDPATLTITYPFLGDTSGLVRDISEWDKDTIYNISFDYDSHSQYFSFDIHEKGGTKYNKFFNQLYEETIRSDGWKKFSTVVHSSKNAESATLHILKTMDDYDIDEVNHVKNISIKNLSIQKIIKPKIVFRKELDSRVSTKPEITFRQINPTKYSISVHNATEPYELVLSQRFQNQWKLFFPSRSNEAKKIKGMLTRFMGIVMKSLTKQIVGIPLNENQLATIHYANGFINEGAHKSEFLNTDTFETWGQDPIAEKTHLPVNGYANAWYIRPEDVQNRTDYSLIIENSFQKLFYGSLLISFVTFLGIVVILFKHYFESMVLIIDFFVQKLFKR